MLHRALEVLGERVPVLPGLSKQRLRNIVPLLLAPRVKLEAGASTFFTAEIVRHRFRDLIIMTFNIFVSNPYQ